ncbi:MAG: TrkA family potassium uptake protein [Mycobacteriales bacterium]
MRIAIAGAGSVGRSIAQELIHNGGSVLLIDRDPRKVRHASVPGADWLEADACELTSLEDAGLNSFDVVIAATGDDKVNLVVSLLAKTEFAVSRVVARINHPANEWMFTESWGVDVAVSTPRLLAALVEEAVLVGDLVRLMTFRQGQANLVEITLGPDAPLVGQPVRSIELPKDVALVAIVRGPRVLMPNPDDPLEVGDELMFLANESVEDEIHDAVSGPTVSSAPATGESD